MRALEFMDVEQDPHAAQYAVTVQTLLASADFHQELGAMLESTELLGKVGLSVALLEGQHSTNDSARGLLSTRRFFEGSDSDARVSTLILATDEVVQGHKAF